MKEENYDDERSGVGLYSAEARKARHDVAMVIDRMETRLSPARLIDDATTALSDKMDNGVKTVESKLRRHPTATGMVGALVGLFLMRKIIR